MQWNHGGYKYIWDIKIWTTYYESSMGPEKINNLVAIAKII